MILQVCPYDQQYVPGAKVLRTDWSEIKFGYRQPAASSGIPGNPHKCCESNRVIGLMYASETCIIILVAVGTLNVRRSYPFSQVVSAHARLR